MNLTCDMIYKYIRLMVQANQFCAAEGWTDGIPVLSFDEHNLEHNHIIICPEFADTSDMLGCSRFYFNYYDYYCSCS